MSSRFSRFLHLERARGEKPGADGQVRLQNGGRFESVVGPTEAPASLSVPEAHVERFKLQGQTPLVLEAAPSEGQRFPRCVQCQTDNGRFARACTTCGADLQAPEQLAYDEELWRAREQAEVGNREQQAVHQKARQEAEAERLAEQQRYMERLREAIEKERSVFSELAPLFDPCLGVGLLRLIPHPGARWATLAGVIGLPVLLARFGNEGFRLLGLYLGVLVFLSFIPTSLLTTGRGGRW